MPVHFKKQAQVRALLFDKAFTEVSTKYFDYSNVFSVKYVAKLLENTKMNEYAIKLKENKQPLFWPIYSLRPVELETLKTYIKTNLTISFIRLFKFLIKAPILFDKKPNKSLRLCMNYWGLNNITIKNQYLLPLISKLLDQLSQVKRFI